MEMIAAILVNDALTHYAIEINDAPEYCAELRDYKGEAENAPPQNVLLYKEGKKWIGNGSPQKLVDDLGYMMEQKAEPLLKTK